MKLMKRIPVWTLILTMGLFFAISTAVSADAAKVSPVKGLQLQQINGTEIKLKWKPSGNCTGYAIYRRNPASGKYKVIGKITNKKKTTFSDTKTNSNKVQKYAVKAYRKVNGKSVTSKEKRCTWPGYRRDSYIGHRGAMDVAPENTMASFQKAHELGYQVFECDVWWTDSKELLIAHDADLSKICGVPGSIFSVNSNTRYNYPIKTKNYENYPTQYFPTMEEVLSFCSRTNMKVLFHFRYYRTALGTASLELPAEAINSASKIIKYHKMTDKVTVISSSTRDLERFSKNKITTGYVSGAKSLSVMKTALGLAIKCKCKYILIPNTSMPKSFVKTCHKNKIKTLNYNITSQGTINTLMNNGCDGWVTNRVLFQ